MLGARRLVHRRFSVDHVEEGQDLLLQPQHVLGVARVHTARRGAETTSIARILGRLGRLQGGGGRPLGRHGQPLSRLHHLRHGLRGQRGHLYLGFCRSPLCARFALAIAPLPLDGEPHRLCSCGGHAHHNLLRLQSWRPHHTVTAARFPCVLLPLPVLDTRTTGITRRGRKGRGRRDRQLVVGLLGRWWLLPVLHRPRPA
mmetsp:Transcript_9521/g.23310  ORF Transcript_9521/g.23310 Transcript_9521/m.23310 type:complete len:200 (+) Transcript_9521:972-1571(+)